MSKFSEGTLEEIKQQNLRYYVQESSIERMFLQIQYAASGSCGDDFSAEDVAQLLRDRDNGLTPEQYQNKLGHRLPGFRILTDPKEIQHRKDLQESLIQAITVKAAEKMAESYDYGELGFVSMGKREHKLMPTLLSKSEDRAALFNIYRRKNAGYKPGQEEQKLQDERQLLELERTAAAYMISQTEALKQLLSLPDKELIQKLPAYLPLIFAVSAADDYASEIQRKITVKRDPAVVQQEKAAAGQDPKHPPVAETELKQLYKVPPEEKKALRRLDVLSYELVARLDHMLAVEYTKVDFPELRTQNMKTLEALLDLAGDPQLTTLSDEQRKAANATTARYEDAMEDVLDRELGHRVNLATMVEFTDSEGKLLKDSLVAREKLEAGALIFAREKGNNRAIPLYSGGILAFGEPLQSGSQAMDSADPEPSFNFLSWIWDKIYQLVWNVGSDAGEAYRAWEARRTRMEAEYKADTSQKAVERKEEQPTEIKAVGEATSKLKALPPLKADCNEFLFHKKDITNVSKYDVSRKDRAPILQALQKVKTDATNAYDSLSKKCEFEQKGLISSGPEIRCMLRGSIMERLLSNENTRGEALKLCAGKDPVGPQLDKMLDDDVNVSFLCGRDHSVSFVHHLLSGEKFGGGMTFGDLVEYCAEKVGRQLQNAAQQNAEPQENGPQKDNVPEKSNSQLDSRLVK